MGGEVGAGKCRDKILKRIMNQNIALGENSLLFYSQLLKKKINHFLVMLEKAVGKNAFSGICLQWLTLCARDAPR